MTPILVTACGMLLVGGVVALFVGVRPSAPAADDPAPDHAVVGGHLSAQPPSESSARRVPHHPRAVLRDLLWGETSTRRRNRRIVIGLGVGVVATLLTGWLILLVVIPLACWGLPWLLGTPPNRDAELLAATDRWIRIVTATMATGMSVPDALRVSVRTAPGVLQEDLRLLTLRLDQRWPVTDALAELADRLDSPDTDAVLAALGLSARRGGTGAGVTLAELSDSISERLQALRVIEAERAKPRIVVRQVTVISAVVLTAALVLGGEFFAPYRTWWGQLVLAGLVAAYVGSLVLMRRATMAPRRERILQHAGSRP